MKNNKDLNLLIATIVSKYGCSIEVVMKLIEITDNMSSGAKFATIGQYVSNVSNQTEMSKHTILLNFSYENMRKDDKETLKNFNVLNVDVNNWNYDSIDLNGVSLNDYKNEVRNQLNVALYEINNPKTRSVENNDQKINDILVFNWNTEKLSILGQSVKKEVILEGDFKKVKSAPKTIAKNLIMSQAKLRVNKYRRFLIDNLSDVKLQGETLQIQ